MSGCDKVIQINICFDAHAVKHVYDVLGGNVSRRALGVGTATETRYRRIDHSNAVVDPSANIGQCLSVGIMQVQRKPLVP